MMSIIVGLILLSVMAILYRGKNRRNVALALIIFSGVWFWQIYFTWQGYFWTNLVRIEALADKITGYKKIHSLAMGSDGEYTDDDGRTVQYDSYRFINGTLITHYLQAHNPDAYQPEWFVDIYCQQNQISKQMYLELRADLDRLNLHGFYLDENGELSLTLWQRGGVPWIIELVRAPDGAGISGSSEIEKLFFGWYIVTRA